MRRKVPIESKAAIEEAIDYMVSEGILSHRLNQPLDVFSYISSEANG